MSIWTAGATGCLPRISAFGELACAAPLYEQVPLIPRSEWPDRIRAKEGHWLYDFCVRENIPCLDQNPLNFCHAYSVVTAAMVQRAVQGHGKWSPAPESVGGPVTNWRDRGAAIESDMLQIAKAGCCDLSFLRAPHSLKPATWKTGWQAEALNHKVTEWWDCDLPGKQFDAVVTCCLIDLCCAVGFAWWTHAISGPYKIIDKGGGKFAAIYRNNWGMDWPSKGANGWIELPEGMGSNHGTPDLGCYVPRQVTPSPA